MQLRKIITHKLSGSALSYTMFIAIVSSGILSAIILGAYYFRLENIQYKGKIQSLSNMNSAHALSMAVEDLDYFIPHQSLLFEDLPDSVEIVKQPWGVWDIYKLTTYGIHSSATKYFSRGYNRNIKGESALYLYDEGRPVSVSGKAYINGVSYLPKAGILSAYINGKGFGRKKLTKGAIKESKAEMPPLNEKRLAQLKLFVKGKVSELYPEELVIRNSDTTSNSFYGDTLIFNNAARHILRDSVNGRVWFHASERIIVGTSAYLENVILTAPIIEIDSGFTGSLQAIATDTILLKANAKLKYPSFLAVLNEEPPATINLEKGASVSGAILLNGPKDEYNQRIMTIPDSSQVEGMVYCNGLIEILGEINGHLTTRKFLLNTFNGIYENYIFDAELNGKGLNPAFACPDLWFYTEEKKTLQWLE